MRKASFPACTTSPVPSWVWGGPEESARASEEMVAIAVTWSLQLP